MLGFSPNYCWGYDNHQHAIRLLFSILTNYYVAVHRSATLAAPVHWADPIFPDIISKASYQLAWTAKTIASRRPKIFTMSTPSSQYRSIFFTRNDRRLKILGSILINMDVLTSQSAHASFGKEGTITVINQRIKRHTNDIRVHSK